MTTQAYEGAENGLTERLAIQPVDAGDGHALAASRDPLGLLRAAVAHYDATVRDYRCRFLMRVRKDGRLGEEQEIAVKFRERPYSVDMCWRRNPDGACRVTYVAGRWNEGSRDLAMIYPAGLLGVFAPTGVKLDIHSPQLMGGRNRGIDQFGFRQTMLQIIRTCERAAGDRDYSLELLGTDTLEGRSCYVLRRLLPYPDPQGRFRERMLLVYLDREWLVPLGCWEYADEEGKRLLGSFVTKDVEFNVGLENDDF